MLFGLYSIVHLSGPCVGGVGHLQPPPPILGYDNNLSNFLDKQINFYICNFSEGESNRSESESPIDDDISEDDIQSMKIIKTNFIKLAKATVVFWNDNECDRIQNLK